MIGISDQVSALLRRFGLFFKIMMRTLVKLVEDEEKTSCSWPTAKVWFPDRGEALLRLGGSFSPWLPALWKPWSWHGKGEENQVSYAMRLQSNNFLYLLFDKWRGNVAAVTFDGLQISASRPLTLSLQLSDVRTAPKITRKWIGAELLVETAETARPFRIRSRDQKKLQGITKEIDRAWRNFNISQWHSKKQVINGVIEAINKLNNPKRYPSACLVKPFLDNAQHLEAQLFSKLNKEAIGNEAFNDIERIRTLTSAPRKLRAEAITKFESQQLEIWSDFFDTFEKNPLTPEQRLSVISDEDATLVLAGAGSGKTSVITGKAGYLIKAGIRNPEEILLLAFARDAAAEMSERIAERCGEPVEARTFHALSYTIIGEVEGGKPALAAHATDDKAFLVLIKEIVAQLAATASEASKAIMAWFTSDRLEDKSEWDFKKKHDYYTHLEKEDLRTV